jgi:hypothetical protein
METFQFTTGARAMRPRWAARPKNISQICFAQANFRPAKRQRALAILFFWGVRYAKRIIVVEYAHKALLVTVLFGLN